MAAESDPINAYQAARAALSERAPAAPREQAIEALRALNNARRSAVKARTAALNQIHHMLITAPSPVRGKIPATDREATDQRADFVPASTQQPTARAVLTVLMAPAKRHQFLTAQADALAGQIRELARATNPHPMSLRGVGPNTAAQLLITAGGTLTCSAVRPRRGSFG